jgi:trimethylamine--corrinoid protein Co-methyltransferase
MVGIGAGGSDAKIVDEQMGMEAAYYSMSAYLSGVDLTFDTGSLECGLGWSPIAAVIGDEVVRMVRASMAEVAFDDVAMSVEAIRDVGPGEHFLAHPQTLAGFRDLWMPALLSTESRAQWEADGSPTMADRARARALTIIAEHHVEALDDAVLAGMQAVIDRRAAMLPDLDD